MHSIARKQNFPEGFNYVRCDGSIFEDIPVKGIHDVNDNNPVADNVDIQPDGDDNEIADVEIDEVHEEVEINEEHNEIDVMDEDVGVLD